MHGIQKAKCVEHAWKFGDPAYECLGRVQHCLVTGGSAGLGLGLAVLLAKRGAHVSIVARNQERLDKALKEVEVR
jgi:NADPH:quinone reductase-like Zn-dependent oxidoreductase